MFLLHYGSAVLPLGKLALVYTQPLICSHFDFSAFLVPGLSYRHIMAPYPIPNFRPILCAYWNRNILHISPFR